MLELLEQLFRQVRSYAQSERYDLKQVYAKSSKHVTMQFDHDAEDIIINGLTESGIGFEIITEERPTFSTSEAPPYRIVIDPIDGSTNFERGIMTAAVALAVLPIEAPILPGR
jgi:myo-inositol-1(or 4)-monophosphatase